ncbi:Uncharacterised protein [Bordetella pertussis]|nr:Uncharacterised protein [Bordetella pertussis]CFO97884.1 Uncharacterised protein [Bordetella pertussis]CFT95511.1 Uncharacterised protein [Bordetella pertussis]CPI18424.1 Uncharacterised protein [Bordetella pertussis]CPK06503.1 Uncharacterised protein [Bordetella pertussis]
MLRTSPPNMHISVAAPTPWQTRASVRCHSCPAKTQASDDRVNSSRPKVNMRRKPTRSASADMGSSMTTTATL